jgi:4-amino-4-deoxy-L-arabinose transferase-like glycosyltransferase
MKRIVNNYRNEIGRVVLVFVVALLLRLLYAVLTQGTYDFDEFVYLLLGRAVAHGREPYRDFLFYHPPGILALVALLNPLASHWWVWVRIVTMVFDAGTCALVYLIARRFCQPSVALAAGFLCASSPIMLTTGTRIMPDVYVAFWGTLSIYLLLLTPRLHWAVLAGVAFGLAFSFKYPAALLLPACLLLARRRSPAFLGAAGFTVVVAFLPFLPVWHQVYNDTIGFQSGRAGTLPSVRFGAIVLYAGLLQPLAIFGLFSHPRRLWLIVAYLSVLAYLATPQVYYHYIAPMVPFASILGALYLAGRRWATPRVLVSGTALLAIGVTLLWSAAIANGGQYPLHFTAAPLSYEQPIEQFIERSTVPRALVLEDRPEAVYLTHRRNLDEYFWNDANVMPPQKLQKGLLHVRYVILTFGPSTGYPPGFTSWVDERYCRTLLRSGFVYDTTCINQGYLPPRG